MTDETPNKNPITVIGYYLVDQSRQDDNDTNILLSRNGHPVLDQDVVKGGGGGGVMITIDDKIIDMGGGGSGKSLETDAYNTGSGSGYGYFRFGQVMAQTSLFRLYPIIGLGGFGGGLDSQNQHDADDSISIAYGGASFQLGLGIDFTLAIMRWRLVAGLRFGVQVRFSADTEAADTPRGFAPFVHVILGNGFN